MKLLIVEDDKQFAVRCAASLKRLGLDVEYAASTEAAFARIGDTHFDIAVIDLMLPPSFGEEGIRGLDLIKRTHKETVCVMASIKKEAITEIVARAMEAGADFFFDKNDAHVIERLTARIRIVIKNMNNAIFISHGHNETLLLKLQRFLEKQVNKQRLVLSEFPSKGRTIVEKLEAAATKCDSAVVLLTKDDEMREGGKRARQNVIHEIGFFQGRYGRRNVILLAERGVELFSNISGIVRIDFDPNHFDSVFEAIRTELVSA